MLCKFHRIFHVNNHLHGGNSFTSSFPNFMRFISFSCLMERLGPPVQHWVDVVKAGLLTFSWFKGETTQPLAVDYDVKCRMFVGVFQFEEIPSSSSLADSFYHKWALDFCQMLFLRRFTCVLFMGISGDFLRNKI